MSTPAEVARAWLRSDPDAADRAATEAALARGDEAWLAAGFGPMLAFGTAGIRGEMGPGPSRMNRALVRRVSFGLGVVLAAEGHAARDQGVVVGHDARRNSRAFAEDTAAVLAGQGFTVYLFDHEVPTPVLAHAVRTLGTAAGVMVTASHNPPADNGYKVYAADGAQVIPPLDAAIAAAAAGLDETPPAPALDGERAAGRVRPVPARCWDAYLAGVLGLRVHTGATVRAVYTAMHGVGYAPLQRVLAAAGHAPVIPVPAQVEPDGAFPTVRFPNPEEPGALDLAFATATAAGATLIIAHDPDADRLAVALPDGAGGWRRLTGNAVGLLLADDLLAHRAPGGPQPLVVTTIVSTALLRAVADLHGAACAEVLTGFKWLAHAGMAWPGPFVLGFEEALGYSAGGLVRDKDGVSTALLLLDLAAWCEARGTTLGAHLDGLWRRVGYSATAQDNLTFRGPDGPGRMAALTAALRADPPSALGGTPVATQRDLLARAARDLRTGATTPIDLPASDVLAFDLADGSRVLVRPSGTEPKVKVYYEVREPVAADEPVAAAAARAEARIAALRADLAPRLSV